MIQSRREVSQARERLIESKPLLGRCPHRASHRFFSTDGRIRMMVLSWEADLGPAILAPVLSSKWLPPSGDVDRERIAPSPPAQTFVARWPHAIARASPFDSRLAKTADRIEFTGVTN